MVHTVDTNVLILATRSGKNFWYLPAHDIATALSPDKYTVLPVLHAFSGFDTVSFFADHGKKTVCIGNMDGI